MNGVIGLGQRMLCNRIGATAIEYALLGALIAVAIIGSALVIGEELSIKFGDVAEGFAD